MKRHIWDSEFSNGKWKYLEGPTSSQGRDPVLDVIDRYSRGAKILDLGCGSGLTGLEIADHYESYIGMDISEVAVGKAIESLKGNVSRTHKNTYLTGDIDTFDPRLEVAVILFRESIYYLHPQKLSKILSRYASFLTSNGVFIVRLHNYIKHKRVVDVIVDNFSIIEQYSPEDTKLMILVFAPRGRT